MSISFKDILEISKSIFCLKWIKPLTDFCENKTNRVKTVIETTENMINILIKVSILSLKIVVM